MSMHPPEEQRQEIIIVRRGGGDDHDAHHGGVWKIAFADFMTAMMCFFLVMWLINAANEQTKMSVASYFNPVKLIDRNSSSKGLDDLGEGPESTNLQESDAKATTDSPTGKRRQLTGPATEGNASALEETNRNSDAHLFADPYAVLAEIARETGEMQNVSEKGEGGQQDAGPSSGASGGQAYRDPFAPDFWTQQVAVPVDGRQGASGTSAQPEAPRKPADAQAQAEARVQEQVEAMLTGKPADAATDKKEQDKPADARSEAEPASPADDKPSEAVEKLTQQIRQELAQALGTDAGLNGISVVPKSGGVLISVMDEMKTAMFAVGSAVPNGELVSVMERIGKTIAQHGGAVTINGHTDGRPFQGNHYDNWQLSTARAQAAYYMLIRSGLQEGRIESVAGFADRRLLVPEDPLDASNRRIEILLEAPR